MMRHAITVLLAGLSLTPLAAAQSAPAAANSAPAFEIGGAFTTIRANAAPGICGCFFMHGGSAQVALNDPSGFSLLFDYGQTRTTDINRGGHSLRLSTYLAGGRYSYHSRSRFMPYGQLLIGVGHSSTNFPIDRSTSTIAFAPGAGLAVRLSARFTLRVAEADYLLTHVPNGQNNRQNQLRLSSGISFRVSRTR